MGRYEGMGFNSYSVLCSAVLGICSAVRSIDLSDAYSPSKFASGCRLSHCVMFCHPVNYY